MVLRRRIGGAHGFGVAWAPNIVHISSHPAGGVRGFIAALNADSQHGVRPTCARLPCLGACVLGTTRIAHPSR